MVPWLSTVNFKQAVTSYPNLLSLTHINLPQSSLVECPSYLLNTLGGKEAQYLGPPSHRPSSSVCPSFWLTLQRSSPRSEHVSPGAPAPKGPPELKWKQCTRKLFVGCSTESLDLIMTIVITFVRIRMKIC